MAGFDWGSLIGAAVSAYGAKKANSANNRGTGAVVAGQQSAIDEQRRQFDLSRGDQAWWMTAGRGALGQMQALNSGDMSGFHDSPDYQYALDQGMKLSDRGAAAHGSLYSGGHSADLMQLGQGLANGNYNNYYSRLSNMAGQGQTTAANLGSLGQNMAGQIGQAYGNIGNARQSSFGMNGYNNANLYSQAGGAFNQWYQGRQNNQFGGAGSPL
jgi:hypothetical protein